MAAIWQQLFDRPYFKANTVPDVDGVQVCGALKNLVAVAAGFCDGMNMGTNTKAALMRIGTEETRLFATLFFHGVLEVRLAIVTQLSFRKLFSNRVDLPM